MTLNDRSLKNLAGVHPDLVRVVKLAAEREPFIVTEGLRSLERQKKLKAAGKSWTLNSRHLTGHAVDVVDPDARYDIPDMNNIAVAMKDAARELGVPIEWGGDWKQCDTPHFELSRKSYPANGVGPVTRITEKAVSVATSKTVLVGGGTAAGGTAVTSVPLDAIPSPPDLSALSAWQTFGQTIGDLSAWAAGHLGLALLFGGWIAGTLFWPQVKAGAGRLFDFIAVKRREA